MDAQSSGTSMTQAIDGREPSRRLLGAVEQLPSWRAALGRWGAVQLLILAALVGWLYSDQFRRLWSLWQKPDWSHGFLIPLFCLYMVNLRKAELLSGEHRGSYWGLVLVVLSLGVYARSIQMRFGYPQPLSMVSLITGLVLLLRGWKTLRVTLFPIAFMLLAIPPPERIYRDFTQPLQQGAATIATFILNMFPGADVQQAGINLAYYMQGGHDGVFTVAGACSGMRSLMAFVALGLAMAYFTPRPPWQRVAMALFVVPVALFCNVLRVITTGACQMYEYGNLATGTPHMVLGLLMFGLGFAIYLAILWGLDHLFVEVPDDEAARAPSARGDTG